MATQRYISTSFWEDPWINSLDSNDRLLYMYLLTSPQSNIAGVYKCGMHIISYHTGLKDAAARMAGFAKVKKAFFIENEWIVIPSWPRHQKWKQRSTIKTGIENVLVTLPQEVFTALPGMGYEYPIDTLSIPYPYDPSYLDRDSERDKERELDPDPKTDPEENSKNAADWPDDGEPDFKAIKTKIRKGAKA